jgi:hypothetical protein
MRIARPGGGSDARTGLTVRDQRAGYGLRVYALHRTPAPDPAHLASTGAPIGDKYGPDERMLARSADNELDEQDLAVLGCRATRCAAHRYRLEHAMTGQPELESPLARDLAAFWQSLESGIGR